MLNVFFFFCKQITGIKWSFNDVSGTGCTRARLVQSHYIYIVLILAHQVSVATGGGGNQLFSGRGVQPGFPKYEVCELIIVSKKGVLWTDHWLRKGGLVKLKLQNLGSCELKIFKIWGLRANILAKIGVVVAKISIFFSKGGFVNWLLLKTGTLWTTGCSNSNGALANYGRGPKRESSGPHIPMPPF